MTDLSSNPSHLNSVLQVAQACEYEVNHSHQVTRLALRLFDELKSLHDLDKTEREWLHYAGILHDIGWIEGWKEHHKVSLRIILTTPLLDFTNKERLIIGSIARYHRKALPSPSHDHFAALSNDERAAVVILAGILRIADGLDRTHQAKVRDLTCKIADKKITLRCVSSVEGTEEVQAAEEKCDLLTFAFQKSIRIEWVLNP